MEIKKLYNEIVRDRPKVLVFPTALDAKELYHCESCGELTTNNLCDLCTIAIMEDTQLDSNY